MSILGAGVQAQMLLREKLNLEFEMTCKENTMEYWTEATKNRELDISTMNNGITAWNSAVKADEKNKNQNEQNKLKNGSNSDFNYLVRHVKSAPVTGGGTIDKIDKQDDATWVQLNAKSSQLELEIDALDSQYKLVEAQYKSMSELEKNDIQNDTVLWCVGN